MRLEVTALSLFPVLLALAVFQRLRLGKSRSRWNPELLSSYDVEQEEQEEEEEEKMKKKEEEDIDDEAVETSRDRRLLHPPLPSPHREPDLPPSASLLTADGLFADLITQPTILTPFGRKAAVYCDWTASGRALGTLESYMQSVVLPTYANTHSIESRFGLQTSCFREEAREMIQLAVGANRVTDVVLFVPNGCTGAIHKLIAVLRIVASDTVVFVGPWEHSSNLIPWRETGARVVVIPEDSHTGQADQHALRAALETHAHVGTKIGSFSAASNITGLCEDVDALTALLHAHHALACWDYASLAPHERVNIGVKDAVFFSPHKMAGGPGASGVLVAKKRLFTNAVPQGGGGGGTVYFVAQNSHRFLSEVTAREEGGTPNICGDIRAGLVVNLTSRLLAVSSPHARTRERDIVRRAGVCWADSPVIMLLPSSPMMDHDRLAIFSFVIRPPLWPSSRRLLHHHFVVALLSDLYGIQARAGCLCAGPYVARLLGMGTEEVQALETWLVSSVWAREQFRPGVVRISLPFFFPDVLVDYVLRAVHDVALHGWRLLPEYRYEPQTGEWGHRRGFQKHPTRRWLAHAWDHQVLPEDLKPSSEAMGAAHLWQAQADEALERMLRAGDGHVPFRSPPLPPAAEEESVEERFMRWFVLPGEALLALKGEGHVVRATALPEERILVQPRRGGEDQEGKTRPGGLPILSLLHRGSSGQANLPPSRRDQKQPRRGEEFSPLSSASPAGQTSTFPPAVTCCTEALSTCTRPRPTIFSSTPQVPTVIMRLLVQASKDWGLIQPGDRLLLGLSGGKDSLTLLHALLQLQRRVPFAFSLACVTVDPGAGAAFDPRALAPYLAHLGVAYFYESTSIFDSAKELNPTSYCAFCARRKRGTLYAVCRREGYTKLVLAQHLDDLVESFFMSLTRNGSLRTMKVNYRPTSFEDLRVIRPLAYVREAATKRFSREAQLPVINENCPACFTRPTERERVKRWLKDQELAIPDFFESLRRALLPLMSDALYPEIARVQAHRRQAHSKNEAVRDAREFGLSKACSVSQQQLPEEIDD